jgi:ribosome recycling factor
MKLKEEKNFNAVEFQRKRRKELSKLYNSNPDEYWEQLESIRKKYKDKFRQKKKTTTH